MLAIVALTSARPAYALTETYLLPQCSTSNKTARTPGTVTGMTVHFGAVTTFNFSAPLSGACASNPFDDAKVVLSGFKWNKKSSTTKICDLTIKAVSGTVTGSTLSWQVVVALNSTHPNCYVEPDEVFFDISFDIIQTTAPYSKMLVVSDGCSSATSDACSDSELELGFVGPGWEFGGFAMTGFRITSAASAGTLVRRAGITNQAALWGSDVSWYKRCELGEEVAPFSGMSCDVDGVLFALAPSEIHAAQSFQIDINSVLPPPVYYPDRQESYNFEFGLTQHSPALCALESFRLNSVNPPPPAPPPAASSKQMWSMWSYAGVDCGISPGPKYNGYIHVNLGDTHPGLPPWPAIWPTQHYAFDVWLNGLQFN